MIDRLTILFITLFCIGASFFIGYQFGKDTEKWAMEHFKESLQVTLRTHGNMLDVEKSDPSIRVIINGWVITGSWSLEIKK